MAMARVYVTIPRATLDRAREHVRRGHFESLSALMSEALEDELRRRLEYRLENSPELLRRTQEARAALRAGNGVPLDSLDRKRPKKRPPKRR